MKKTAQELNRLQHQSSYKSLMENRKNKQSQVLCKIKKLSLNLYLYA